MLRLPEGLGHEEWESKILNVKRKHLESIFRELGMVYEGNFEIKEHRYIPTEEMKEAGLSMRLRCLRGGGDRVEHVIKQKHPPVSVPGFDELGKVIKHRTEMEVGLHNTNGTSSTYEKMLFNIAVTGMKEREWIQTEMIRYSLGKFHYELQKVVAHSNKDAVLPPRFLEIEVPEPAHMADAVQIIGYRVEDLCALTKREVIAAYD